MRTLLVCVAIALFAAVAADYRKQNELLLALMQPKAYEDRINQTIEDLKVTLNNGDEANGIPSFNPLQLAELYLNLSYQNLITTDITLNDLVGTGLTDFVATHLKFNIVGFAMDLTVFFNHINLVSKYTGDMHLLEFIPVYGTGDFNIDITDLEVSASFKLGTAGGNVTVDDLELTIGIGKANFDFTGLLNDPDGSTLLSAVLTDVCNDIVHNRGPWVTKTFSPIVSEIANSLVEGMTVDDLLDLITGGE